MVRCYKNSEILATCLKTINYGLNYKLVKIFYSLNLEGGSLLTQEPMVRNRLARAKQPAART